MISDKDFKGLLFAPFTAFAVFPLSNKASTASWSILFSFLIMISGASSSVNLFNLLFLLITLLYKSLTSETANFPPSSDTRGLKSGGKTGSWVNIIHSGLFPEFKKFSTTFNLLIIVFLFASDFVEPISSFKIVNNSNKSIVSNKSLTICPPMLASKPVCSNKSAIVLYCSSFKISYFSTFLVFSLS